MSLKCIKGLNKCYSCKTLTKKMDINLYNLGLDNGFLGTTPKPEATKNWSIGPDQNLKFSVIQRIPSGK